MRRLLLCLLPLLVLPACDSAVVEDGRVEITLLAAYTTAAAAVDPDHALVAAAVAQTNDAYARSGIRAKLRLVHVAEVAFTASDRLDDLRRLVRPADGTLDEVHALRDEHAADLVVLVVDHPAATINAAVLATPETAFAVIHVEHLGAPHYALAHELGHLQGARHSADADPTAEPFAYGHATRAPAWRTILATGQTPVIPYFSNPDVAYQGLATGDAACCDNARVLDETAVYIAGFRGPQLPTDFVPPGTWPVTSFD